MSLTTKFQEVANSVPGVATDHSSLMPFASSFHLFFLLPTGSVSWMWTSPSLRSFMFWEERWLLQEVTGWEGSWPVALIAGFLLGISATPPSSLFKINPNLQTPNVEPAAVEDSWLKRRRQIPSCVTHTSVFRVTLPLFFFSVLFYK